MRSPWAGAASAAPKLPTLLFSAGLLLSLPGPARALSCATHKVVLQAGGGDCTTIGACLPSGTLTGDYCVDIQDNATYSEQVTVQNVATAGFQIVIGSTAGVFRPTIAPPASSTAAFVIANASVSVLGLNVAPASAVTYGVFVSSPYVTISSVNVLDAGGKIAAAGVAVSSWTTLSYSSVTVGGATATGIWLPGSVMTSVSYSSAQANGSNAYALRLTGASTNTIAGVYLQNQPGYGAYFSNATGNSLSGSSIACAALTGNAAALYLQNSSSNTVTQTYLRDSWNDVISLNSGSNSNTITQSTAVLTAAGGQAALALSFSDANVFSGLYLAASGGVAADIGGSKFNNISQSTLAITNGMGQEALLFNVSSSNTVTQCAIANPGDTAVAFWNGSAYNSVSLSTITAGPSSNLDPSAIRFVNGSYNTISRCVVANPGGWGVDFGGAAVRNTVSQSTIVAVGAGYAGLFFDTNSSSNVVTASYVQGSTGAYLSGAQNAVIDSSVLVATGSAGNAVWMRGGSSNLSLTASTLAGGPLGAGLFLDSGNTGPIIVSSDIVGGSRYGLLIASQGAGAAVAVSSLTFSALAAGATAVNFMGGVFVSTFASASFDSSVAINVNAASLSAGSRLTMTAWSGAAGGPAYEQDPSGYVDWASTAVAAPSYAGCAVTENVGSGQTYATIQSAVNALPSTLTGPSCVVIRDGATYAEQVTVRNFTMNGSSIAIFADPASGLTPVVSPPGGAAAAFVLANASVSVKGINVVPTNAMTYGIVISSAYVSLSSVNVQDAGGLIASAGIVASSWTSVADSSVTVGGAGASGFLLQRSVMSNITRSSATAPNAAGGYALWFSTASSNTVAQSVFTNSAGTAVYVSSGSNLNSISLSMISTAKDGALGLEVNTFASSSTVSQSFISNTGALGGYGARLDGNYSTVSRSTITAAGSNTYGIYLVGSFGVLSGSYFYSPGYGGGVIWGSRNTISSSVFVGGNLGAYFIAGSSNSAAQSVFISTRGSGAWIVTSYNSISQSTITANGIGAMGLYVSGGSSNSITQCSISNLSGVGVAIQSASNWNTVSQSTITGSFGLLEGVLVYRSSSNVLSGDVIRGPVAVHIDGSTGTVIDSSVLVATAATGTALLADHGAVGFTLSNSYLAAPSSATGISLAVGNSGVFAVAGATVAGAKYGLAVATQTAGTALAISGLNFSGLTSGATAIHFTGGTFVSTFSGVSFDSSSSINVDAVGLSTASRITMSGWSGTRGGHLYEHDPGSLVDWIVVLPAAPVVAGSALGVSSISWTWTATANADSYNVYRATDGALLGNVASPSYVVTGLSTNTAFGITVAGMNGSGYGAASGATVYTLAEPPGTISFGAASSATVALAWSSGTNPAGTLYEVSASTGAGYAVVSTTTLPTSTATGLAPSTAYSFRVRALNGDMIGSAYASTATTTLPPVPGGAGIPSGAALGVSSISWSWAAAANAASYNVYAAASGALLGNVATTSYLQAGLSTNTAYGIAVAAWDASGLGALSGAATTYTLAEAPEALTAGAVSSATAALDWAPGGNPAGTLYELSRSTGGVFTVVSTGTLTTSTATGLSPSTAFAFRVRAINGDGIGSAYASTSTTTLPPLPGGPGTPAGVALGISSISWTWTAAANASSYAVYEASSPSTSVGTTPGLTLTQTGLAPNTTASVFVQASNASGAGVPSSSAAAVYTLANPPAGLAALSIQITSATLGWSLNGNPSGTVAELERSTDGAAFRNVFAGAAVSAADSGLAACTTYYYRVRDRNGASVATAYSGTVSFTTLASAPLPPSSLTAEAVAGSRILLTWGRSASEGVAGYRLYEVGSGTGSYGAAIAVFVSTETSYLTAALSTGFHGFALRSFNRCGVEESSGTYASVSATAAVSGVRAEIKVPNTGKRIRGNSVTIVAELIAGLPADAGSVTLQIKPAAGGSWTDVPASNVNHPNPVGVSPYFIQWDADAYAAANGDGWYDLRAVATNVAGSSDTAPSSIRVELVDKNVATRPGDDYDIKEDAGSKDEVINNAVPVTLGSGGLGAEGPAVTILLPAGAVNASTATATVVANPVITTAPPAGMALVGSSLQVELSSLQSALNSPAVLTLTYPPSADAYAEMRIESLDPLTGAWSPIGASTRDRNLRTVTASTPHFSVFAIVAGSPAAIDLSGVRAYPVPYKPNGVNPNEGKPYSAGDATSGIVFDRLPPGASIKIYTLGGRLTAELSAAAGGAVHWDAKNGAGRDAASGGYFAVVTAPGSKSVVKRLLIIR